MFQRFEQALADAVNGGRIAGAVALATDRGGPIYEHAAGLRAAGQPAPMDTATVFWIASMTKAIVSVAALQLVEHGRLTLDGDLAPLVPELGGLEVLEAGGLRPAKGPVTLRQLLTHTSGFAYGFSSAPLEAHLQASGVNPNDGSPVRAGSTASASIGRASSSRPRAASGSTPIWRRTCSSRWA